jgi:hypothetical protein
MAGLIAACEALITRERALIVAVMLVPVMLAVEALTIWADPALRGHLPFGHDFGAFWSAARLTAMGAHEALYDPARFWAEQAPVSVRPGFLSWHYPPTFLLFLLPLAGLGFAAAWLVFSAGGIAALALAGRRVLPVPGLLGWAALLGAPVIGVTLVQGQNGAWVAAALIGGLWARERGRGWLAALLFACLAAKPHLALLLPLALVAARDWRLIGQTALMVGGLIGLSVAVLGVAPWQLFWAHRDTVQVVMADRDVLAQMPTAFAASLIAGLPLQGALLAQGFSALLAGVVVWRVWADRGAAPDLKLAVLLMAALLLPPYGFRYDLVLQLGAVLLLARIACRESWLLGEKLVVAALWAGPALFPPLAYATPMQAGFLLQLLGLWAVWRRFGVPTQPNGTPAAP